jgi:hypothetical protein
MISRVFLSAAAFAVAGLLARLTFRHIETRWQIVFFCLLAVIYEFKVLPLLGKQPSEAGLIFNCLSVAISITVVKLVTEGFL